MFCWRNHGRGSRHCSSGDPQEEAARDVARQLRGQGLSLRGVAAELERCGSRGAGPTRVRAVQVTGMVG